MFGVADAELGDREGVGKLLRMVVQAVQVVLAGIEEIAHLIVWHGQCLGGLGGAAGIGGEGELIAHIAVAAVDIHQRAGDGGVVIDQLGELLQLDGGGAQLLALDDVLNLRE